MKFKAKSATLDLRVVKRIPWIWAAVGAFVMWVALGIFAHNLNLESLIATSTNASFLAIVALGQMLVITTGGGAIDLSIPNVITLSAFLCAGLASGSDLKALQAVPLVLLTGAFIGLVNALTVLFLRIPPIIATLGTGYIITTAILIYNAHFTTAYVAPILLHIARDRLLGVVPLVLLITLVIVVLLSLMLTRTRYGKCLIAVGQNLDAARLTGIPVNLVRGVAYVLCSTLAAFGGIMISAQVNGAFLGLGDPYLLQTVGSVVVGGTLIFGGRAVPLGTLLGSLFLVLLVTAMQVAGLKIGGQLVAEGLFIILVLFLATEKIRH
jgi:ribose transport system permease protein